MAEARQRSEWGRTALLAYLLAEPNRDHEEMPSPFKVADFNPFSAGDKTTQQSDVIHVGRDLSALKCFIGGSP